MLTAAFLIVQGEPLRAAELAPASIATLAPTLTPKQAAAKAAEEAAANAAGLGGLPANADKKITLTIVGDSVPSDYEPAAVGGWGQYLSPLLAPGRITVVNRAQPGRSAKAFMEAGAWKEALRDKPDYVIIQFGREDVRTVKAIGEKAGVSAFKKFLGGYVETARKGRAVPILVTPVASQGFDELKPLVEAVRSVADLRNVSMIDLYAESEALESRLRQEKLDPEAVARIVAHELPVIDPRFHKMVPSRYKIKLDQIVTPK